MIESEEWLRLVAADPELAIDSFNGPCFANFSASVNEAWLDWAEGNIYTSYPDKRTFTKMLEIARQFDAHLQGDDGEIYQNLEDYPGMNEIAGEKKAGWQRPLYLLRQRRRDLLIYALVFVAIAAVNLLDIW